MTTQHPEGHNQRPAENAGESNPTHQPKATVIKADRPSWLLISAGLVLIAVFAAGVVFSRAYGSETTETSNAPAASTAASSVQTEKTTKSKNSPSDTLLTAILASGAALILGGALYSRISTITLPGGVSVGLTTQEAKTTKDAVNKELKGQSESDRAKATQAAIDEVRKVKEQAGSVELNKGDVNQLATNAARSFRVPPTT